MVNDPIDRIGINWLSYPIMKMKCCNQVFSSYFSVAGHVVHRHLTTSSIRYVSHIVVVVIFVVDQYDIVSRYAVLWDVV